MYENSSGLPEPENCRYVLTGQYQYAIKLSFKTYSCFFQRFVHFKANFETGHKLFAMTWPRQPIQRFGKEPVINSQGTVVE
jgi:hypothetical protein